MENVLDVRGGATLRQIREMAGRAMLDGPHDYATEIFRRETWWLLGILPIYSRDTVFKRAD